MNTERSKKGSLLYLFIWTLLSGFGTYSCFSSSPDAGVDEVVTESDEADAPESESKSEDSAASDEDQGEVSDEPSDEEVAGNAASDEEADEEESDEGDEAEDEAEKTAAALPSPAEIEKKLSESNAGAPGPMNEDPVYIANPSASKPEAQNFAEPDRKAPPEAPVLAAGPQAAPAPLTSSVSLSKSGKEKDIYFVLASRASLYESEGGAKKKAGRVRGDRVAVVAVSGSWAQLDDGSFIEFKALGKDAVGYERVARAWVTP